MRSNLRPRSILETRKCGVALLTILLLMMVMLAVTATAVLTVQSGLRSGNVRERNRTAAYVTQSALQLALKNIQDNGGALDPNPFVGTIPGHPTLGFRVEADKNEGAEPRTSSFGDITLPPGHIDLKAVAILNGEEVHSSFGQARKLAARADLKFEHALFETDSQLKLFSTTMRIDSYDSAAGIEPFRAPMPAVPPPVNQNASVRAGKDLNLGNGMLYGDVQIFQPQPGNNVHPASPGPTILSGAIEEGLEYIVPIRFQPPEEYRGVTPLDPPPAASSIVIEPGRYSVTSYLGPCDIVLKSGVYYFDSLKIYTNARVRLDLTMVEGTPEPVVVYIGQGLVVAGEVNMESLAGGPPPRAANLQVYMLDEPGPGLPNSAIGMYSTARFRGAIAAGLALMDLNGGAELFGAFVVGDCWFDMDILLHQDTSLVLEEPVGETAWVLYREVNDL